MYLQETSYLIYIHYFILHFSRLSLIYRSWSTFAGCYSNNSLIFKDLEGYFVYLVYLVLLWLPKGREWEDCLLSWPRDVSQWNGWISSRQGWRGSSIQSLVLMNSLVCGGRKETAGCATYFNRIVPICIPATLYLCAGERSLRPTRTKRHAGQGLLFALSLLC